MQAQRRRRLEPDCTGFWELAVREDSVLHRFAMIGLVKGEKGLRDMGPLLGGTETGSLKCSARFCHLLWNVGESKTLLHGNVAGNCEVP